MAGRIDYQECPNCHKMGLYLPAPLSLSFIEHKVQDAPRCKFCNHWIPWVTLDDWIISSVPLDSPNIVDDLKRVMGIVTAEDMLPRGIADKSLIKEFIVKYKQRHTIGWAREKK